MNNLNKTQKIIVGIVICIIIAIVYYYINNIDNDFKFISVEETDLNSDANTYEEKKSKEMTNLNKTSEDNKESENAKEEFENIIVHISGAVIKEGVVELKKDSRVSDAIEKGGGLKEDANIKDINLAYKLEDGMKIYIPNNAEQEEKDNKNSNLIQGMETNNISEYVIVSEEKQSEQNFHNSIKTIKVNINTATQTELETLPGIGPSTALKIINYRNENGNFRSIEEIKNVVGIGNAKFEGIKEYITI